MRTPCRVLAILGFLFLGTPAIASADWQLTPFLGFTFKGDTTLLDLEQATDKVHWTFGGSVAFIGGGPVGVEGLVVYTPGFFQQDDPPLGEGGEPPVDIDQSRTLAIMGNVVLTTPRSWNEYGLRPFISGGIGLLNASAVDTLELQPVIRISSVTTSAAAPSDSSRSASACASTCATSATSSRATIPKWPSAACT